MGYSTNATTITIDNVTNANLARLVSNTICTEQTTEGDKRTNCPRRLHITNGSIFTIENKKMVSFNRTTARYNDGNNNTDGEFGIFNSTFIWGTEETVNGEPIVFSAQPMVWSNGASNSGYAMAFTAENSTIEGKNRTFMGTGNFRFVDSTVNWVNMKIVAKYADGLTRAPQIRFFTGIVNVDGLIVEGKVVLVLDPRCTIEKFKGYQPIGLRFGIGAACASGHQTPQSIVHPNTGSTLTFDGGEIITEDFSPTVCDADVGLWRGGKLISKNSGKLTLTVEKWEDSVNAFGAVLDRGTATVNTTDLSGNSIDVKLTLTDNPNGGHTPFDAAISYDVETSSGTCDLDILLGYFYLYSGYDGGVHDVVLRSATQSDKVFTFDVISYGITPGQTLSIDFLGIGNKVVNPAFATDFNLTLDEAGAAALTECATAQDIYDAVRYFEVQNYRSMPEYLIKRSGNTIITDASTTIKNITTSTTATDIVSVSGDTLTVKCSASLNANFNLVGAYSTDGVSVSGFIEDINGVRVTVQESGGGNFNILAYNGSTKIGFFEDVSSKTFLAAKGDTIKIQVWQLGKMLYYKEIDTTDGGVFLDMVMLEQVGVDTSLDVSSIIANTEVDITGVGTTNPIYSVTFKAAMTLPLEEMKSFLHRALGDEDSLTAALDAQGQVAITIQDDEITVNSASFKLYRGPDLSVDDRVIMAGFINVDGVSDPAYQINPRTDSGTHVIIQAEKPTVDYTRMSEKNKEKMEETNSLLDRAHDHAQFANAQTQGI